MNTLQKQFCDALKREGKNITTFYTSESVKCLFRKNNDNNNVDNHIMIFYEITAPIKQGMLLTYGGKQYLTLNQESVENDIYYKSALIECNLLLPVKTKTIARYIPSYIGDLSSPGIVRGNVITVQDGTGEILTEATEDTMNISTDNNTVNIIGGYYDVVSQYYRNGISYITIERGLKPVDTYTFDITADNFNVETRSSVTLSLIPKKNDEIVSGQTFTLISSNDEVATVDKSGTVSFLTEGSVTITGTWVEQNIADTITFVVTQAAQSYTITISGSDALIIGGSKKTYTPTLLDSVNQAVIGWTAVWTINYSGIPSDKFMVTYSGNDLLLQANDDMDLYDYMDNPLILTCTTSDNFATGTIEVTLDSGW